LFFTEEIKMIFIDCVLISSKALSNQIYCFEKKTTLRPKQFYSIEMFRSIF